MTTLWALVDDEEEEEEDEERYEQTLDPHLPYQRWQAEAPKRLRNPPWPEEVSRYRSMGTLSCSCPSPPSARLQSFEFVPFSEAGGETGGAPSPPGKPGSGGSFSVSV